MQRLLAITLASLTLFAAPGLVPEAQADHNDWVFGTAFRVGDFFFRIGFHPDRYHRHGDFFIRIQEPLSYRGYECSKHCYRNKTHYYHHRSCSVVRHHFDRYGGYDRVVGHYFPRSDYGYYGAPGYYRDHDRYDRHDRHDRHRGYRGRGHYRGHGHHRHSPYCGHHY